MKKLSIVLAVALAFAAVAPALAAPSLALTGSMETKFTATKDDFTNETFLNLQAGLQGGSDKTKGVVILSPWSKPDKSATAPINSNVSGVIADPRGPVGTNPVGVPFDDPSGVYGQDFANKIRSAYLQTTGAFWHGGPEATTTIGSISVNESPFVGDLGNRRGIKIEGLKVGPLGIEAFYATPGGIARTLNYDGDYQNQQTDLVNVDRVQGVRLDAKLAGLSLGANIVRSDENDPEMAFTGSMAPAENMTVDAYLVRDRNENQVMKVGGSYALNPNLTLSASYRSADEAIAPMYPTRYDDDGNGVITTDEWIAGKYAAFDNKTGAKVGADLRVAGVHVNGSYDMATTSTNENHVAKVAADTTMGGFKLNGSVKYLTADETTELAWGAEREFQLGGLKVLGSYTGERDAAEVMSHEFKAATTLDMIPQLKGLALDGRVKVFSDSTPREIEANAKYQAPNGMTFGISHEIEGDNPGETSFTAGLKVQF